jgi:hypothetical protein
LSKRKQEAAAGGGYLKVRVCIPLGLLAAPPCCWLLIRGGPLSRLVLVTVTQCCLQQLCRHNIAQHSTAEQDRAEHGRAGKSKAQHSKGAAGKA